MQTKYTPGSCTSAMKGSSGVGGRLQAAVGALAACKTWRHEATALRNFFGPLFFGQS